jgi:hypothetical protein
MTSRDESDARLAAALDAYRAAARAEADGHFDDRALEAQRHRILSRLEQAGQRARVLAFPGAPVPTRTGTGQTRRWISAAAAAGLLIGLVTGELLHVMPGDNWVHREPLLRGAPPAAARMAVVPAIATTSPDADDALLDAIELAVTRQGSRELRAFDDFTFGNER